MKKLILVILVLATMLAFVIGANAQGQEFEFSVFAPVIGKAETMPTSTPKPPYTKTPPPGGPTPTPRPVKPTPAP